MQNVDNIIVRYATWLPKSISDFTGRYGKYCCFLLWFILGGVVELELKEKHISLFFDRICFWIFRTVGKQVTAVNDFLKAILL